MNARRDAIRAALLLADQMDAYSCHEQTLYEEAMQEIDEQLDEDGGDLAERVHALRWHNNGWLRKSSAVYQEMP